MNLVRDIWQREDAVEFKECLETYKRENKIEWTKNILNTSMPVLAIKSPDIQNITKQIRKGNYLSFLDLDINDYYENMAINGNLISIIKDFSTMKHYLDKYSKSVECWASCDLLKFNVKKNEENFFKLAEEYIESDLPFVRRIGMSVLFKLIDNDLYIDKIYEMLNRFENEQEYYVNMLNAWLLCELFIKRRDKTIEFLKNNKLNKFTINKGISKCRDSFRVSKEDKEFLLSFKK